MGNGIFPDEATISIVVAGIVGSAVASSDSVTGEVSNYSESGGERDTESLPVFGGGNIDKENPRSQVEVSLDVEMQYLTPTGLVTKWDAYKYGAGLKSATEGVAQAIFIQWTDGTNFYSRCYNNAKGVSWNPTSSADGNLKGTMTFKLSPTTASGVANVQVSAVATSAMVSWA